MAILCFASSYCLKVTQKVQHLDEEAPVAQPEEAPVAPAEPAPATNENPDDSDIADDFTPEELEKMSSQLEKARRKSFKKIDTNKDGSLGADELLKFSRKMYGRKLTDEETDGVKAGFTKSDSNGDGAISFEEFNKKPD